MIITLLNQKGGVGKTTSTFAIGAALTEMGHRVLMVDLDPQGSLTTACGIDPDTLELTIYTYLRRAMQDTETEPITLDELDAGIRVLDGIRSPGCLHLLPANIELSAAELDLVNAMSRERILAETLQPLVDEYDVILIDCLPSLGLLAINALAAADGVLVPLQADFLAMKGLRLLLHTTERVQRKLNPRLRILGILLTMADGRTRHSREVIEQTRQTFAGKIPVLNTVIRRDTLLREAPAAGVSILQYASESETANAYRAVAKEILNGGKTR